MIVVDTSAAIDALIGTSDSRLIDRLRQDDDRHAPHLIDIELLNVLRRLVAAGQLSAYEASEVRAHFSEFGIQRYPHEDLSDRIWALRNNITPYDAAFVALSEALEVPLITCDARLAASVGHSAQIELYVNS